MGKEEKQIKCPRCGNTDLKKFRYLETADTWREVVGLNPNGQLEISGLSHVYDDSENDPRLECQGKRGRHHFCGEQIKFPQIDIEWV